LNAETKPTLFIPMSDEPARLTEAERAAIVASLTDTRRRLE
jgi:hypothetical protein